MEKTELALVIMFSLNSWIYLHFDTQIKIAQALQCIVAIISILFISIYGLKSDSYPYILCLLVTGLLTSISFSKEVDKYFMLIPLIFLVSIHRIRRKLSMILQILLQSLWMYYSIVFCFCLFGFISYCLFSQNTQYFNNPAESTLTYLQVATLDQVGKITLLNYQKFGFLKAFVTMILSLALVHTLFNFNQAIIMQYVYRKRHYNNIVGSKNMLIGDVRIELRIIRIINIIVTPLIFMFPFQQQQRLNWLIMTLTMISTFCIASQHSLQNKFYSMKNIVNLFIEVIILILFGTGKYYVFFLFSTFRIFLLQGVLKLWVKILQVVWHIAQLFSMSSAFFLIFSVLAYSFENTEKQHVKIQVILIKALQFLTLDDWTSNIRHNSWQMTILIIIYVMILNHIFLNALISQAFGQFRAQINGLRQQPNERLKENMQQFQQQISDRTSAEQFWIIASTLCYQQNAKRTTIQLVEQHEQLMYDLSNNDFQKKITNETINAEQNK